MEGGKVKSGIPGPGVYVAGGGDICDGQAVVNVQLGHNASNGQVATMDSWQMQTLT